MLINEIANECKVTRKAVQYYVEEGLLSPKILENGYKDFSKDDEELLKMIVLYRKLGLSINQIKSIFKDPREITHILHQRVLESEREKVKQDILKRIENGENILSLASQIQDINSNTIITNRLIELFPGHFGKFISLNFARYLTGTIETQQQLSAFYQIIEFFDNVPDIELPKDLQQYLDELSVIYADEELLEQIFMKKDEAILDIDNFMESNKELIDQYLEMKKTEEYMNSSAYRLTEYMKDICSSNGYYDTFIPAMRMLSPSYNEYYERLLKANDSFLKTYPILNDQTE